MEKRRLLLLLTLLLASGQIMRTQLGDYSVGGVRPGMTRPQVERLHPRDIQVHYAPNGRVEEVSGTTLERGSWPLAGPRTPASFLEEELGAPLLQHKERASIQVPHRRLELDFVWADGWKLERVRLGRAL